MGTYNKIETDTLPDSINHNGSEENVDVDRIQELGRGSSLTVSATVVCNRFKMLPFCTQHKHATVKLRQVYAEGGTYCIRHSQFGPTIAGVTIYEYTSWAGPGEHQRGG